MSTPIIIELFIADPVELELSVDPGYQVNTVQTGPVGPSGLRVELRAVGFLIQWRYVGQSTWTDLVQFQQILEGDKSSSTDAGEWSQISLGDDYLYVCTKTGTAGNAIWKKMPMFYST